MPADPDGGCACALAFSTLLSSQGADAHHPRSFGLFRGNPTNLPALAGGVKRLRKTWLTWLLVVPRAYPHFVVPEPGMTVQGGNSLFPGDCRLSGWPCRSGQDETVDSKGDLVKSRATRGSGGSGPARVPPTKAATPPALRPDRRTPRAAAPMTSAKGYLWAGQKAPRRPRPGPGLWRMPDARDSGVRSARTIAQPV